MGSTKPDDVNYVEIQSSTPEDKIFVKKALGSDEIVTLCKWFYPVNWVKNRTQRLVVTLAKFRQSEDRLKPERIEGDGALRVNFRLADQTSQNNIYESMRYKK